MGALHQSFEDSLEKFPLLVIENIIAEKLAAVNVDDPVLVRQIAEALMANEGKIITIKSPVGRSLDFTEEDMKQFEKAMSGFMDELPDFVDKVAEMAAQQLVEEYRSQWKDSQPSVDEAAKIQTRIAKTWGGALDALRLVVALCCEEGETFNFAQMKSNLKRDAARNVALARLHIRACRIAEEIILLVSNGHTEGAQGRWRTLHEVAVTATLIAAGGDAIAERYFAHEAIERKKALNDYRRAAATLGVAKVSGKEADTIERECDAAVRRYGRHFQSPYGWAGGMLGLPDAPQFHNLQEVAGKLGEKLRFRLACFDTHASPQALRQPIHGWDPTTHISGMFSAGFEAPIGDTAQSIVQITLLLFREPWNLDRIAWVLTLARLRDDLIDDVDRIARRIEKDEQRSIERAMRRPGRTFGYVKPRPIRR
ncbi:DUF5677 domain-containing protein [Sphingosinicella sp.]|uniref:DUF5677 domain-containing protein n=1 Tax=Sphingosinicella sp. TaxID=1917971 RepID=UPI00178E8DFE|nr:DUF5677 domain-containing protein [Sphingosinicella sp.]MBA4757931.1 hypothetical protein [Sphingosinicella sp.]